MWPGTSASVSAFVLFENSRGSPSVALRDSPTEFQKQNADLPMAGAVDEGPFDGGFLNEMDIFEDFFSVNKLMRLICKRIIGHESISRSPTRKTVLARKTSKSVPLSGRGRLSRKNQKSIPWSLFYAFASRFRTVCFHG